jgi:putative ABC transport system permease protein
VGRLSLSRRKKGNMTAENSNSSGPGFLFRLLRNLLPSRDRITLSGDFEELYALNRIEKGRWIASMWLWGQIFKSLPGFVKDSIDRSTDMLNNHIKITWRTIKRHKVYSLINIAGLAVGMACFLLIFLYVRYELNYDRFHEETENIVRIISQRPGRLEFSDSPYRASTPPALAPALMQEFPEVEAATRFRTASHALISYGEKRFYEDILFADENFFKVFPYKWLNGDKKSALKNRNAVVLTRSSSKKFFGQEDPLGKIVVDEMTMTGVVQDVPPNSHIQFTAVLSFSRLFHPQQLEQRLNTWHDHSYHTYCRIRKGASAEDLEKKLSLITEKYLQDPNYKRYRKMTFEVQPMRTIHLRSNLVDEFSINNDIRLIYLFSFIAVFILLIACMNYTNLSTARASQRAMEIGVRKVLGAGRRRLIRQFLSESLLFSLCAFIISLLLIYTLLPRFSAFVSRPLDFGSLFSGWILVLLIGISFLTAFMGGSYPAFYISSFRPVRTLKGAFRGQGGKNLFRKVLISVQFAITIALISSGFIILKQINHIRNTDTGYNREQILVLNHDRLGIRENLNTLKDEFARDPSVLSTVISAYLPTEIRGGDHFNYEDEEGQTKVVTANRGSVGYGFCDVFGIKIIQGRNFSRERRTDYRHAFLVNQAFVDKVGWKNPIGKKLSNWIAKDGEVVGVIKNFNFRTLHNSIQPLALVLNTDWSNFLAFRLRPENMQQTLPRLEKIFGRLYPGYPFDYRFLDEIFDGHYRSEQRLGLMMGLFSILAVFIACLGLFGLISYSAERRTKEIGIRKVLGAPALRIMGLLLREFGGLILISLAAAWPMSFLVMNNWLKNFAYRANIGIDTFLISGLFAFVIALLTVSFQVIKSATANPVDTLRYE